MAGPEASWLLGLLVLLLGVNAQNVSRECPELGKTFHPIENQGYYVPGCYAEVQPQFFLHQSRAYNCTLVNSLDSLGTVWPCVRGRVEHLAVLFHGFTGGKDEWWIADMWRKILAHDPRPNVAVLIVDWSYGAGYAFNKSFYYQAAANTRYVGAATALIVRQIDQMERPSNLTVHCVGHSLGAHVCGFFGAALAADPSYGRKLDRITGSDPAGPLFLGDMDRNRPFFHSNPDWRLDPTDAAKVDVIHTDGDSLGTMEPLGHTDFYIGVTANSFGFNQACCWPPQCDHEESISTLLSTITATPPTYHTVNCSRPYNSSLTGCTELDVTPQLGYFYDGSQPGFYGLLLPHSNKPRRTQDALETGLSPISNSPLCKPALSVVTGISKVCPLEFLFNWVFNYSDLCATISKLVDSDMVENVCQTCHKSEMSWENVEIVNKISQVNLQLTNLNDQLNLKLENLNNQLKQFFDHSLIQSILIDEMKAYKYIKKTFRHIQYDSYGLVKKDSYSNKFCSAALEGSGAGAKSLSFIRSTLFDAMTGKIPLQNKRLFQHLNMCQEYPQLKEIILDTYAMELIAKEMSNFLMLPEIFKEVEARLIQAEHYMVMDCKCPTGKVLTYHEIEKTAAAKVNSSLFECQADIMIETVNIVEKLKPHDAARFEGKAFCAEHPGWAEWGSWGAVTNDARRRQRSCTCPPPRNVAPEDNPCPHSQAEQTQEASSGGWGAWSQWSNWSHWSTSRRSNDKMSRRRCNSPAPTNGGPDCSGPSSRVCRTSEGWTCGKFGSYREHTDYLNKPQCEKKCSELGGELPTVHSRAEAHELYSQVSNWSWIKDNLWLGASRTYGSNPATFSWDNGEKWTYNWNGHVHTILEEILTLTHSCVMMSSKIKMSTSTVWHFRECSARYHCVCVSHRNGPSP